MKIAYFDCFSGVSGNMILGTLIDIGLDADRLNQELRKLPLAGYQLEVTRVVKQGIAAIYVDVITQENDVERTLPDIYSIIDRSTLSDRIKGESKQIFTRLGEAEAKVHNQGLSSVHLHEIGAIDTFIDIVGALVGLEMLGVERVISSPLNMGKGLVKCAHGVLPVPAPVTAELLKGVPVYSTDIQGELTTPTGAAIITGIAADFGHLPPMMVEKVGYGAGKMDFKVPNLVRLWVGKAVGLSEDYIREDLIVLETNIDDMNPQFYDHIMESLLRAGALDVFLTPVQMKKNRPGVVLSVVTARECHDRLLSLLFEESTTLGVRITETNRLSLPRSFHLVKTRFGEVRIKIARKGDTIVNVAPEYEDCKKAAIAHNVAISQVYNEAQKSWNEKPV